MANQVTDRKCGKCNDIMNHLICPKCNANTIVYRVCYKCGLLIWGENLRITSPTGSVRCLNCERKYHHDRKHLRRKGMK